MVNIEIGSIPGDPPSLVAFPQGFPDKGDINLTLSQKGTGRKRKQMVHGESTSVQDLVYNGIDFNSQSHKKSSVKFAVGVYDKEKDTFTLFPTDHAFLMRTEVVSEGGLGESAGLANYERKQGLTSVFGTAKKKRAVKANAAKVVKHDNVQGVEAVQNAMNADIGDVRDVADGTTVSMEQHRKSMLPSYDPDAEYARKIYDVYSIVGRDVIPSLAMAQSAIEKTFGEGILAHQWTDFFNQDSTVIASIHSSFITNEGLDTDAADLTERLSFENKAKTLRSRLLYLHGLLVVYNTIDQARFKKADKSDIMEKLEVLPDKVVSDILRKFATMRRGRAKPAATKTDDEEGEGNPATRAMSGIAYELSPIQTDKLLMHIIVLMLTQNQFKILLDDLVPVLRLSLKRLIILARECGCKVVPQKRPDGDGKERRVSYASLNAPISFPKKSRGPA